LRPSSITEKPLITSRNRLGYAWVGLTLALAIHVADKVAHDFPAVYNPAAAAIRARLPFLPLPVFSFHVWLTGLILAVLGLLALSPLAFRSHRRLVRLSFPFALLALLHRPPRPAGQSDRNLPDKMIRFLRLGRQAACNAGTDRYTPSPPSASTPP
jgi:hypothetical protein